MQTLLNKLIQLIKIEQRFLFQSSTCLVNSLKMVIHHCIMVWWHPSMYYLVSAIILLSCVVPHFIILWQPSLYYLVSIIVLLSCIVHHFIILWQPLLYYIAVAAIFLLSCGSHPCNILCCQPTLCNLDKAYIIVLYCISHQQILYLFSLFVQGMFE